MSWRPCRGTTAPQPRAMRMNSGEEWMLPPTTWFYIDGKTSFRCFLLAVPTSSTKARRKTSAWQPRCHAAVVSSTGIVLTSAFWRENCLVRVICCGKGQGPQGTSFVDPPRATSPSQYVKCESISVTAWNIAGVCLIDSGVPLAQQCSPV
ncbi:hypothetical protein BDU57DRAFT_528441 [Ampelomyces quisqualis]|uniref:Uncharacterized protein n=1 Tax=Ampelomyces quisqualis TaxID=50730 RepID=A0A6A5QQI6_AMPQU|nr:hypothetical protein BDU57DRAFT_528441 [Ampelomyces quisqualis]